MKSLSTHSKEIQVARKEIEEAIRAVMTGSVFADVHLGQGHPMTEALHKSQELLLNAANETVGLDLRSDEGAQLVKTIARSLREETGRTATHEEVFDVLAYLARSGYAIVKES